MNQPPTRFDGPMPDPQPGDIIMVIRDGTVFITIPDHAPHSRVPENFVIALGVARAFGDPDFRKMMRAVVDDDVSMGNLNDIVTSPGVVQ